MKFIRLLPLIISWAFVGAITLVVADYLYVSSDSWGASEFRSKLIEELQRRGQVRVGDLVPFKWEKIYFLGPYSLSGEDRLSKEIGGEGWGLWWDTDERFSTIVYRRPGTSPFIVKIDAHEWILKGRRFATADHDARIVLIGKDNPLYGECPRDRKFCILLD